MHGLLPAHKKHQHANRAEQNAQHAKQLHIPDELESRPYILYLSKVYRVFRRFVGRVQGSDHGGQP